MSSVCSEKEKEKEKTWLLYSSEVSGAIGLNKYKKRWEVLINVWRRVSKTYEEAVSRYEAREAKPFLTRNQKVEQAIERTNLKDVLEQVVNKQTNDSSEVRSNLMDLDQHLRTYETDLRSKTNELEAALAQQVELKQMLTDSPNADPAMLAELEADIEARTNTLSQQKRTWTDYKEAKKDLSSSVRTKFGQHREAADIRTQAMGEILENNGQFYKMLLGTEPHAWGIGGKIDGMRNNVLVEIKNRVNAIFNPIPQYDLVQIHCYMHLLNVDHAIIIQCLNDQRQETPVKFDAHFWTDEILPGLESFVRALDLLIKSPDLQDQILAVPDGQKFRLINPLFKNDKKTKKTNAKKKTSSKSKSKSTSKSKTHTKSTNDPVFFKKRKV